MNSIFHVPETGHQGANFLIDILLGFPLIRRIPAILKVVYYLAPLSQLTKTILICGRQRLQALDAV